MDIAELGYRIDSTDIERGNLRIRQLGESTKRADAQAKSASANIARSFKRIGAAVAVAGSALFALGGAFRTIKDFDSSMSQVAAISRATTTELAAMRDIAKELGSTTEFTASQAADGLKFLSMAGFEASESVAAIPAVLDLATASAMGLGRAADIASNIMSAFSIAASDSSDVADVLAAVSSRANTSVEQLGTAMAFVGPVAAGLGVEMEKAAAAIGVLSDNGLQGSMAGTGLRRVMSSLANVTPQAQAAIEGLGLTIEELNPATTEITEIVQKLADAGLTAADALTIFGDRGGPAILALTNNTDRLRELTAEMRNVDGEAKRMADTMRDNLGGDVQSLWSAVQGLAIAIGEAGLTSAIRAIVQTLTLLARGATAAVDGIRQLASAIYGFIDPAERSTLAQASMQAAIDNTSIAVGDYINASRDLARQIQTGSIATIEETRAQLESARARRSQIELLRQERMERALASPEYQALQEQMLRVREAMNAIAAPGTDADTLPRQLQDAYEQAELRMIGMLKTQQQYLAGLRESGALNEQEKEALAEIEANIAALEGRMAEYNAEGDYSVQWTERLNAIWPGIVGDVSEASKGVQMLGQALGAAVSIGGQLAETIRNIVNLLPNVSAGFGALGNLASNMATGVKALGNSVLGSEGLAGLGGTLSDISQTIGVMFESAVRSANAPEISTPSVGGGGGGGGSEMNSMLREAERLYDSTRTAAERYAAEVQKINDLHREFPEIVTTDVKERALDQLAKDFDRTSDVMDDYASTIKSSFGSMIDEFVETGKIGEDALLSLAQAIVKLAVQAAAFQALAAAFPSVFGASGSIPLVANAKGNAFENGKVQPFAKGGVVSRPTLFPMAKGAGLMGEAGPEAIMPLKRGSDGKLGVEASGAAGEGSNVEVNVYGGESQPEVRRSGNRIDIDFRKGLRGEVQNGSLDGVLSRRYGIKPKPQGA